MSNLTASKISNAKPKAKLYRLSDGKGLALTVRPNGSKSWQLRYTRPGGKAATATLGTFPDVGLADARKMASEARGKIQKGEDPVVAKRRERAEAQVHAFRTVTEGFLSKRTRWSKGHMARFRNRMEIDVWPMIGNMPVGDIQAIDVMTAIRPILERGAIDSAKRTIGMIGQVMTYAVTLGLAKSNPAIGLSAALEDTPAPKHRAAIVHDHESLGRMLDDLWAWEGGSMGQKVLQMLALTFARPGEVRHMRWSEIDGDLWRYKVSKTGTPQIVPLSLQALEIIESVRPFNGHREYVFANPQTGKPISGIMPMSILRKIGWDDVQSAHGFRAVARTELIETLDYDRGIVEFQLSHRSAELHGAAYDRTTMIGKRRVMMQAWSDWLDSIRRGRAKKRLGISAVT